MNRAAMTTFDDATAVTKREPGRYEAHADPRFALVAPGSSAAPPAVNGGVLMATVLRAVLDEAPNPHPVATSANFLRVPRLGAAEVQVSWLKQGKTASTARAALVQDGAPVVDMTVTTGTVPGGSASAGTVSADPADGSGEALAWTGEPPAFPALADCVDLGAWPGTAGANGAAGFAAHVTVLLDPAVTGWRGGQPSGVPEMRGYVSLREPRDPDALLLAFAIDALPPVVFGLGATGWAPTVELTWHMRAVPQPGPLRVATRCRHVSGGWFDEEAEVWDATGRLVAQSRQLARVGRGPLRVTSPSAAARFA
jgi:acyl-coenzyme A thioesterase PaaI-like protein